MKCTIWVKYGTQYQTNDAYNFVIYFSVFNNIFNDLPAHYNSVLPIMCHTSALSSVFAFDFLTLTQHFKSS